MPRRDPSRLARCAALVALAAPAGAQGPGGLPHFTPNAVSVREGGASIGLPLDVDLERGQPGLLPPQPLDVVADGLLVHDDDTGSADQVLVALAGRTRGGFGALWSDRRDGVLGLYLSLLDADGELASTERRANPSTHSRQVQSSLALGANLAGGMVWFATTEEGKRTYVRFFDDAETWTDEPLGFGPAIPLDDGGGSRGSEPVISIGRRGDGSLVWTQGGAVVSMRFQPGFSTISKPVVLNADRPTAVGRPCVALDDGNDYLVAWTTGEGQIHVYVNQRQAGESRSDGGAGELLDVVADPSTGGWFALIRDDAGIALRSWTVEGKPRRPEDLRPVEGKVAAASIATFGGDEGLALLVERAPPEEPEEPGGVRDPRWAAGPIELHLLTTQGGRLQPRPLMLPGEDGRDASGARLASQNDALLVAWTDRREGNADVYYRRLGSEVLAGEAPPPLEDLRWNTDERTADQLEPDVDALDGRVVCAWTDYRFGEPRVFARELDERGAPLGAEVVVGALPPSDASLPIEARSGPVAERPSVAAATGGRFLVTWKERPARGRHVLMAQAFGPGGAPLSAPTALDPGHVASGGWVADAVALEHDRGYLVHWIRPGQGPFVRHLDLRGRPLAPASSVQTSGGAVARNPSLCRLDGGRVLALWDLTPQRERQTIAGRILSPSGEALTKDLHFPITPEGGDWRPVAAPAAGGGFLLGWTGHEGPFSDVFAHYYDASGRPVGDALSLSTAYGHQGELRLARLADGTHLAVWSDDLAEVEHVFARRIVDAHTVGETFTANGLETEFWMQRRKPRVAPVGDGVLVLWEDAARSTGWDIRGRVLGPGVGLPE